MAIQSNCSQALFESTIHKWRRHNNPLQVCLVVSYQFSHSTLTPAGVTCKQKCYGHKIMGYHSVIKVDT